MATKKTHEPLTSQARIGIHEHHALLSEWPNSCFLVEWLNFSFVMNYSFERVRDHSTRVCFCICHLWTLPLSTWWCSHGGRLLSSTTAFWTVFGSLLILRVFGYWMVHASYTRVVYTDYVGDGCFPWRENRFTLSYPFLLANNRTQSAAHYPSWNNTHFQSDEQQHPKLRMENGNCEETAQFHISHLVFFCALICCLFFVVNLYL